MYQEKWSVSEMWVKQQWINHPYFEALYHPSMVKMGMIHILLLNNTRDPLKVKIYASYAEKMAIFQNYVHYDKLQMIDPIAIPTWKLS